MNKTTFISAFLVFANLIFLNAQVAKQGFDEDIEKDNWQYTSNIPFYSENNNTDLWRNQSNSNGRINGPFSGSFFLAARDLDNEYSEQQANSNSPEHILTFDEVDINGLEAELSFRINYIGIDKGDYIYFELLYNDNTNWNMADYKEDVFKTSQNGNFNSIGWQEVKYTIPTGKNSVKMRLVIYQNGNEYLGFDEFSLKTTTLSIDDNVIDGLSFGPNPTKGVVNLKADVVLDRASIYNVLGKEIISKEINNNKATIDFSSLSAGIYIVRAKSGEKLQTFKIIKK